MLHDDMRMRRSSNAKKTSKLCNTSSLLEEKVFRVIKANDKQAYETLKSSIRVNKTACVL